MINKLERIGSGGISCAGCLGAFVCAAGDELSREHQRSSVA